MAKKNNGGVAVVERVKKPKTAKQAAKVAANVAAAAARLKELQTKQRLCNSLRKAGYSGTDEQLMLVADRLEREREARMARDYVLAVLAGPHGARVSRFLGDRVTGEPTKVASVVRQYCRTQGW